MLYVPLKMQKKGHYEMQIVLSTWNAGVFWVNMYKHNCSVKNLMSQFIPEIGLNNHAFVKSFLLLCLFFYVCQERKNNNNNQE